MTNCRMAMIRCSSRGGGQGNAGKRPERRRGAGDHAGRRASPPAGAHLHTILGSKAINPRRRSRRNRRTASVTHVSSTCVTYVSSLNTCNQCSNPRLVSKPCHPWREFSNVPNIQAMENFAVIIPAAGLSARFGAGSSKQLQSLAGRPVVTWAAEAFLRRNDVSQVVLATRQEEAIRAALGRSGHDARVSFVAGGESRALSVQAALEMIDEKTEWVAVHDGARPLVSQELIQRTLDEARRRGAAAPALPVQHTMKQATGPLPAKVERTVPRQTLWGMQTPQIMRRADLAQAFAKCPVPLGQVTDDAQLLELAGVEVWLVSGEQRNLKITTPADLSLAELLVNAPVAG
jgi:2-C-methyl-D-erythritol 4-phosphate cytidylyltransferase